MSDPRTSETPLLEARDIKKSFQNMAKEVRVLSGASLKIWKGDLLGIIGASGTGKSTFLHILGGLDHPHSGQVFFKGQDIFSKSNGFLESYRNRHVGFVFQFFNLLSDFNALENVMMPALIGNRDPGPVKKEAETLLERVGLKDRLLHKPGALSGGECQRVALARSLINNPDLLLADEPTGNLDTKASEAFMQLVHELNEEFQQTFVIVTHSQKLAQSLNRTVQLANGETRDVDRDLIL